MLEEELLADLGWIYYCIEDESVRAITNLLEFYVKNTFSYDTDVYDIIGMLETLRRVLEEQYPDFRNEDESHPVRRMLEDVKQKLEEQQRLLFQ